MDYQLNDIVEMKKQHPCKKSNQWKIVRMGADIKIKCLGCGAIVMFSRREFEKKLNFIIDSKLSSEKREVRRNRCYEVLRQVGRCQIREEQKGPRSVPVTEAKTITCAMLSLMALAFRWNYMNLNYEAEYDKL